MGYRKKVKHYHEPGDLHELTFSCYRRMPLLTNDEWLLEFCQQIDRANESKQISLVAFVLMPEHVHLLIFPLLPEPEIDRYLSHLKRPYSYRIQQHLLEKQSPLLDQLTVRERPGKTVFRFWQEVDSDLPTIHGLPQGFFMSTG